MVESVIALIGNFVLPYVVLSLFAMLIVELIAAVFELRGRMLRLFIRRMLFDTSQDGIAQSLYKHPLVASLSLNRRLPAYIPSDVFAIALVDTVLKREPNQGFVEQIRQLPNRDLSDALGAAVRFSFPGREIRALERWYTTVMDGASGAYRLRTLLILMGVGVTLVLSLNFDAIRISNHVARRTLIERVVETGVKSEKSAQTGSALGEVLDRRTEAALALPIGWSTEELRGLQGRTDAVSAWSMKIAGWITSILAIALGAPFLFDLLNRFMIVRSTVKPFEGFASPEPAVPAQPMEGPVPKTADSEPSS